MVHSLFAAIFFLAIGVVYINAGCCAGKKYVLASVRLLLCIYARVVLYAHI